MAPTQTTVRQQSATPVSQSQTTRNESTHTESGQSHGNRAKDKKPLSNAPEWRRGAAPVRPRYEPKPNQRRPQPCKATSKAASKQEQGKVKQDDSRFQSTNPFDALLEEQD
ncbi:hypothetical protein AC579_7582 [Pseudocercospora musae]|uniref:Uncharacterized protein n=1 Tax=Pseudocercospora musae TaxID=113226 RepID=A0A139I1X0_9PEZI|nr:hypothetical protein AC579_7582 [Pseudocercospora musae]